jgi:hypothetical protein
MFFATARRETVITATAITPGGTGTTAAETATKARVQRVQFSPTYGTGPMSNQWGSAFVD